MIAVSTLFIVNDIDKSLSDITETLPIHSIRIIRNEEEGKNEFQILQAQKAIRESYIADNETKYICLCGDNFRVEAQNALLKVLEEPPKNIIFYYANQPTVCIVSLEQAHQQVLNTPMLYSLMQQNHCNINSLVNALVNV